MIKADFSKRTQIVNILCQCFFENLSVNYVVGNGKNSKKRIKRLMEYSFDMCLEFGEIFINKDCTACALIIFSFKKKATLKSIFWNLKLVLKAIGLLRLFKVLKREATINKNHPKKNFSYLWFIGVVPDLQKRGIGTEILKSIIKKYEKERIDIYLETSVLSNIFWYEKNNFEVYKKINFNYTLQMLRLLWK